MTPIEQQALALINEVRTGWGISPLDSFRRDANSTSEAFCRTIERHEAFKREVSDAVEGAVDLLRTGGFELMARDLGRFVIPKADPLVEAIKACEYATLDAIEPEFAADLRKALADRGLEIVEKKP